MDIIPLQGLSTQNTEPADTSSVPSALIISLLGKEQSSFTDNITWKGLEIILTCAM